MVTHGHLLHRTVVCKCMWEREREIVCELVCTFPVLTEEIYMRLSTHSPVGCIRETHKKCTSTLADTRLTTLVF